MSDVGCAAVMDAVTVPGETDPHCIIGEDGHVGALDEYGSGLILCWADVGRERGTDEIVCIRGHTLREMLDGAVSAGRPNAERALARAEREGWL